MKHIIRFCLVVFFLIYCKYNVRSQLKSFDFFSDNIIANRYYNLVNHNADEEDNSIFPYKPPFYVKDSVIYDQNHYKVKLWGVNYLAPFNHNYVNIEESGMNHFLSIDKDIKHFKLMGTDFIRVHLYDREITDVMGNLIENNHLKVFDYLVEQSFKNGIFLMLTAVGWWNTITNEVKMRKDYAYWDLSQQQNFGFSNFFAKDAILWHPQAIECQKKYLKALFNHINSFSGKRLCEYENIIAIELINEPKYIQENNIENEPLMGSDLWLEGSKPNYLKQKYNSFLQSAQDQQLNEDLIYQFRGFVLEQYFSQLWPIVDECFSNKVLKTHIEYDIENNNLVKVFRNHEVKTVNVVSYISPTGGFDGSNSDWANFLPLINNWFEKHCERKWSGFSKIVYEFGSVSSLKGYPMGAFAKAFQEANIQMAAFFTYTPASIAEYNPGWLVHYLNLEHTPIKAAAFAAAGEVFRNDSKDNKFIKDNDQWMGSDFIITYKPDNVVFYNEVIFRYAATTTLDIDDISKLQIISGRENSKIIECDGTGSYYLQRINNNSWQLFLFADQMIVNDPAGIKKFRSMANRYMNINEIPVVSRLFDKPVRFQFKIGKIIRCEAKNEARSPKLIEEGKWELYPGEYFLELD